jgi:hypothetical protein
MKVSLKMIFTMVMVDLFILMETTTSEIGLTGSGQATENLWINQEEFMKANGSIVSLWVNE